MARKAQTTWTCDLADCDASVVEHEEYGELPKDWVSVELPPSLDRVQPMYNHVSRHFCCGEHAGIYIMQHHAAAVVREAERDVRRTREEDILHETPDPMDIAARTSSERVPPVTQALVRERHMMGLPITLIDHTEMSCGVVVVIYQSRHGNRIAIHQNGEPKFGGMLD